MLLDLNLIIESLTTVTFVAMKVSDRIGAQMNYSLRIMHSSDCLSLIYSENRRNMLGRTGGPLHSDQIYAIQLKKNNHVVFICQRANRGECKHAVCHECHEEHSKGQKRPRGGVLGEDELMQTCHHELCNLQLCADVWWCTRDYLGGPQWSERAIGCAFCERMFTVGDK